VASKTFSPGGSLTGIAPRTPSARQAKIFECPTWPARGRRGRPRSERLGRARHGMLRHVFREQWLSLVRAAFWCQNLRSSTNWARAIIGLTG
jgi:hypothetical protein